MIIRRTLLCLLLGWVSILPAQIDCNNPILLNSVTVSNTTCGNSTGTVILNPAGGSSAYAFIWTPAVSFTNIATNLEAGNYQVRIVRANNPLCFLDTTVVVNNSNGPQVQTTVEPAKCLADNGKITLTPTDLLYNWNTGAGTNSIQNLASGNYYVTATNAGTGCFSISKIFVPRDFAFPVNVTVLKHAKCGKNIGQAEIMVPSGSGQYSYSLGPLPQFNSLAAGTYTCLVTDNVTGCSNSVGFTINDLPVSGQVQVTPHDARCPGTGAGSVEFNVIPGNNFALPFTYTLTNGSGQQQSPGNLAPGAYSLHVSDADLCMLLPVPFTISQPPPISVQVQTIPETCTNGGSIHLNMSGGNGGPFLVNWLDLSGDINPANRSNLNAGLYSAVIFDTLYCEKLIDNVLIAPQCNGVDTAFMVLKTSSTDFFCRPKPVGLTGAATTFSLTGGATNGSSAYGAWFLNSDGCLSYSAGPNPGFAVDTICIVRSSPQIGLKDTLCLLVTIVVKPPTQQTVFFAVQAGTSTAACGAVPPAFQHETVVQIGRPGLSGTSDVYGSYIIDPGTACLTFSAGNSLGFGVDEIRVAVCDTVLNECHLINYLPSVIAYVDCALALQLPDSMEIVTNDCNGLAIACVGIPYDDIVNYSVIDNGTLYNAGYSGCNPQTRVSYHIQTLPAGGGPFQITEWMVNGQNNPGTFLNLNGLATLLNQLDPNPGWVLHGANYLRGGNTSLTYGSLKIKSAANVSAVYDAAVLPVPLGTELRLAPGQHTLIFKNVANACSDTLQVNAVCIDCFPIHSNPLDAFGNVEWATTDGCAADTVFCTNILASEIGQYDIKDNNQPFSDFTNCNNYVGMRLDTGFHLLNFVNTISGCTYNVRFYLECKNIVSEDTVQVQLPVGGFYNLCLDTSLLNSPVAYVFNQCEDDAGSSVVSYSYDESNWCVNMIGTGAGQDTLCLQICDGVGQCANVLVYVNGGGAVSDSLLAVADVAYTLK
ncbi:MAG: hypothetical protein JNJ57_11130, partial [Saprospiraceae bacterium]|nr:hypothetical protein [Saprospiraceae bacterium]